MITHIGIVVPAANEQRDLPACLSALCAERDRMHAGGIVVRIVVVLDACTDRSAEVVAAARDVEVLVVAGRSVGAARAAGVTHLLAADVDPARVLLAATDADSVVPVGWLAGLRAEADAGADLVLGTVLPGDGLTPGIAQKWHAAHRIADGHPHIHGANLAIRASVYLAAGGWAPLRTGEDVDLVERVLALDGSRVSRIGRLPVSTSVRTRGRAPAGFAGYLRELAVGPGIGTG